MTSIRKPTQGELKLIYHLIKRSGKDFSVGWTNNLLVKPLDDGGMGSLSLYPNGVIVLGRKFGKQVSDFQFIDSDGITVIASLYLDKEGELYELDIWKTNFEKLLKLPEKYE